MEAKMEVNQKQMKTPLELRQHLCPYVFALKLALSCALTTAPRARSEFFLCLHSRRLLIVATLLAT